MFLSLTFGVVFDDFFGIEKYEKMFQFEDVVLLDCVIYLLDEKFRMNDIHRGNPIYITRRLSALVRYVVHNKCYEMFFD